MKNKIVFNNLNVDDLSFVNITHEYFYKNQQIPSVTTVLNKNSKLSFVNDKIEEAIEFGNSVHGLIDKELKKFINCYQFIKNFQGIVDNDNGVVVKAATVSLLLLKNALVKYGLDSGEFEIYSELVLGYEAVGSVGSFLYAGTADVVIKNTQGEIVGVFDFKTGAKSKNRHLTQCLAYAGGKTGNVAVIYCNKDLKSSISYLETDQAELETDFYSLLVDYYKKDAFKDMVGLENLLSIMSFLEGEKVELQEKIEKTKEEVIVLLQELGLNKYSNSNYTIYKTQDRKTTTLKPAIKETLLEENPEYFTTKIVEGSVVFKKVTKK